MTYSNLGLLDIDIDLGSLKGTLSNKYPGTEPGMELRYYYVNNYKLFYEKLPMFIKLLPDIILIAEINGPGHLGAHRDHGTKCVLNWYVESNNDRTFFYKEKLNAKPFVAEGETVANIYSLDEVEIVDTFTAKDNEMYLLNVSEIHSVLSTNKGVRRFVNLAWRNADYNTILQRIRTNGLGN
jgi:hypothetical protein